MAKPKPSPSPEPAGGDQISTRLFKDDSLDLRQLAALLDISAAEAYRRVCAPVVKTALRAELARKAAELGTDRG